MSYKLLSQTLCIIYKLLALSLALRLYSPFQLPRCALCLFKLKLGVLKLDFASLWLLTTQSLVFVLAIVVLEGIVILKNVEICSFGILWSIWLKKKKRIFNVRYLQVEVPWEKMSLWAKVHGLYHHFSRSDLCRSNWNVILQPSLFAFWDLSSLRCRTIFLH